MTIKIQYAVAFYPKYSAPLPRKHNASCSSYAVVYSREIPCTSLGMVLNACNPFHVSVVGNTRSEGVKKVSPSISSTFKTAHDISTEFRIGGGGYIKSCHANLIFTVSSERLYTKLEISSQFTKLTRNMECR